jgi:hypothetical protein
VVFVIKYQLMAIVLLVLTACPMQPPAPSISLPVSGSSTNSGTPSISGTGVSGATVTVVEAQTTICTATVNSSNAWTCTPNAVLSNASHTISATQIDSSSLSSPASEPVTFTVNVIVAAPVFTSPTANTELINENLEFKGSGIAQFTVTVLENTSTICISVVTNDGSWSCKPSAPLPEGTHGITATQTNLTGITSAPSPSFNLNIRVPPKALGTVALEWNTTNRATINDSSSTVAFKPLTYSDIDDIVGGFRYLTVTFEASKLGTNPLENLTLRAFNPSGNSSGTSISDLNGFPDAQNPNGVPITDIGVFQSILPTHGTRLGVKPEPDPSTSDFQAYATSEAVFLEQHARIGGFLSANDNALDYGYVAQNRKLEAGAKTFISIAVKLPRKFTNSPKPYKFKLNFLITTDPVLRVTRGLGETTAAALTRALALGTPEKPAQLVLIGSDTDAPSDPKISVLRLPSVRIGTAPTLLPIP